MKTLKEYLSTGQAAALCSVTPDTVLKWVKSGKLKANRTPGGHYRILRSDLSSVMAAEARAHSIEEVSQKPLQYCWEFNSKSGEVAVECQQCIVYRARARRCYEMSQLPSSTGHARLFCTDSCDDCDYFQIVSLQRPNILVVTDKKSMRQKLEESSTGYEYNLRFTDCEYHCSMIVDEYRPDYVILDCSMGLKRAKQLARHIAVDTRIPFVRVVLVTEGKEVPSGCDREVFALMNRPVKAVVLDELIEEFRQDLLQESDSMA